MGNQRTTPRPLSRRPSGPPPRPKRDNSRTLEGGTTGNPRVAAEFTFKAPSQGRRDGADGSPSLPHPDTPVIEVGKSNSGVPPLPQGPTQKVSRKTSSSTVYRETNHSPGRSKAPQRSTGLPEPPERSFLQGNRVPRKVQLPQLDLSSATFEGRSPTLQVAASRSPKQSPTNSQREDDQLLQPSAGLGGTDRAGVTDRIISGEEVPSRQQSRLVQRTSSTKSLGGNNRRRDGESPLVVWREPGLKFSSNRTSIVRKLYISREPDALPEGNATVSG